MRINPILTNSFYNFSKTQAVQNKQNGAGIKNEYKMPNYSHYLSFMGGSSLNLKESVANLDALSDIIGEKFPPEVHSEALEIIKNGNPEGKTLIDIHKNRYSLLNDCYDLDDAKALFDEFKGVLSDSQTDYMPDSFIGKVKKGEIENFNKDEDLAFQLLKLYWAEGFSLNDLKEYSGVNLYHTLNKFNIPLMDRDYAHVLKFSDKEYNERLTNQMAQKRMESMDRRVQERDGEPVYIPRGPLSESHRKHISEGLIKHYAEHPEKLAMMSERQKKYFEDNPEQVVLFKRAVTYAWNKTQEGKSLRKHMVKFFKKQRVKLDENVFSADFDKMSNSQQEALKNFWKKNKWAGVQFSKALTKGWAHVKSAKANIDNFVGSMKRPFNFLPSDFIDDVKNWAVSLNIPVENIDFDKIKNLECDSDTLEKFTTLADIYKEKNENTADIITSAIAGALMSVRNEIRDGRFSAKVSNNKDFLDAVALNIEDLFYPDSVVHNKLSQGADTPRLVSYEEVTQKIDFIIQVAALHNQKEFPAYLESKINQAYKIVRQGKCQKAQEELLEFLGEK